MDSIIQAIDIAKANDLASRSVLTSLHDGGRRAPADPRMQNVQLEDARLEAARIVAHKASSESKSFDALRSQVLPELDKNGWQCLGITSPTAGCGKSMIACNLSISIARLAERGAVLVDLDLQKPSIAAYLGLKPTAGVADVLLGKAALSDIMIRASVGSTSLIVVPGVGSAQHSSDLLASQSLTVMLETLRREFRNRTIIIDLPSVLTGDEVVSCLPKIDAALLVAAAGTSTIEDVRDCRRYLEHTPILQVVINKNHRSKK